MPIICGILFLLIFILLLLIEPRRCSLKQEETFCRVNYAHKGLHSKDGSIPENSLEAFRLAAEKGYGIELDIRLTKDQKLIVFHDDLLKRNGSVIGKIDSLDYADIVSVASYVPEFSDVLQLVNGQVPLLVELKSGPQRKKLCEMAAAKLDQYTGAYCIESFDPRIVAWFRKHRANVFRGQLSAPMEVLKSDSGSVTAFIISRLLLNCIARPHFIAHEKGKKSLNVLLCEWLGAKQFVWTVRDTDDYKKIESKNDSTIFEYYFPTPWTN